VTPPQRLRTGGRVAGRQYAPGAPSSYGSGRFPNKDYSAVQPLVLRDALEWWQEIGHDVQARRHVLELEQQAVATQAGGVPEHAAGHRAGRVGHALQPAVRLLGLGPAHRSSRAGSAPARTVDRHA
jgi:hypothetical protein